MLQGYQPMQHRALCDCHTHAGIEVYALNALLQLLEYWSRKSFGPLRASSTVLSCMLPLQMHIGAYKSSGIQKQ